jgi:phosphopantothenoylcysteine synthetase/decarboxylase
MNCVVTAGPTYEPLDEVRRLTNFSTGQLGTELAAFLVDQGHQVTLLVGESASWQGARRATRVGAFTTTSNLREQLKRLEKDGVNALFHVAAVSDFGFGKVFAQAANGDLKELHSGKFSTGQGTLLAELSPTPKIIAELRDWFPRAKLIGWKYEVDGDRSAVLLKAREQLANCRTDACVANGPAYGDGYGLVSREGISSHLANKPELFKALEKLFA